MNSLPKLSSNQIWQTIPIPVYKSNVFNNESNNESNNDSNNTSPQELSKTKVNHIDLLFQQGYIDKYFGP